MYEFRSYILFLSIFEFLVYQSFFIFEKIKYWVYVTSLTCSLPTMHQNVSFVLIYPIRGRLAVSLLHYYNSYNVFFKTPHFLFSFFLPPDVVLVPMVTQVQMNQSMIMVALQNMMQNLYQLWARQERCIHLMVIFTWILLNLTFLNNISCLFWVQLQ